VTSIEERLRIQGFPEGWKVAGPPTAQGLQVGNAIPPTLARVALVAALDVVDVEGDVRLAIDATCPGCEFPEIGYAVARSMFSCSRCGHEQTERPAS
jgi:hypothetical protein